MRYLRCFISFLFFLFLARLDSESLREGICPVLIKYKVGAMKVIEHQSCEIFQNGSSVITKFLTQWRTKT